MHPGWFWTSPSRGQDARLWRGLAGVSAETVPLGGRPAPIVEVGMVGRDALREYVRGALWVLPTLSVLAALAAGAVLSSFRVGARSPQARLMVSDAEREVAQPADLDFAHAEAESVLQAVAGHPTR